MTQKKYLLLITIFLFGSSFQFSCKKADDGLSSLINQSIELPGENCEFGGQKIESGIDSNGNGILESQEVQQTEFVCNGEDGSAVNHVRLNITSYLGNESSEGQLILEDLIDFNIQNYPGMDSAILVVKNAETLGSNSNIIFELYDFTNSTVILDSEVKTNSTTPTRLYSANFIKSLPKENIDIGIKIRSEINGIVGGCDGTYLFLYKN